MFLRILKRGRGGGRNVREPKDVKHMLLSQTTKYVN